MEIIITGKITLDPRDRVLALEATTRAICEEVGLDPAEGTMMLLTAAVHMAITYSAKPIRDIAPVLADALGCAIVAADDFFTLKQTA